MGTDSRVLESSVFQSSFPSKRIWWLPLTLQPHHARMGLLHALKNLIKASCRSLGIDLTKNMQYDRLTSVVIRNHLKDGDVAIDIGAHRGEILDEFLAASPRARHIAVEPIPSLAQSLHSNYGDRCEVHACALSDHNGQASFQVFRADMAYSGLRRRDTGKMKADFDEVTVDVRRLDDLIPSGTTISLIKIDVEGGEFEVLRGSEQLLKRDRPLLIFESGLGASEFYGGTPSALYAFLNQIGYHLQSLPGFVRKHKGLSEEEFCDIFNRRSEYYFVAFEAP